MGRLARAIILAALGGLAALPEREGAAAEPAGEATGMARIIDGETIALGEVTLRLYGIDAPELGQVCRVKGRPYDCGEIARAALMDLTAGTPVVCRILAAPATAADRAAGIQTARCTAGGYDLSEGMAYTGWALAQREVTGRYVRFEADARAKRHGLWKGEFVTPEAWRAGERLSEDASPK